MKKIIMIIVIIAVLIIIKLHKYIEESLVFIKKNNTAELILQLHHHSEF